MCGIVGIISTQQKELNKIEQATKLLSKRGPDFQSTMLFDGIALGHARLSIIDTSEAANQPFSDRLNRYTLIFNGEIYNYKELRAELEQQGMSFLTQSDTEVLLNLYIKYGKDCLEKLNGFFAFAVYDKQ
ncbi:MAG: asparagine synthetase B, partial [Flavobacteriales bacterium CG_4_9_14_0_2_um_filter_32_27]